MHTDWLPGMIGILASPNNLLLGLGMHMGVSVVYGIIFGILLYLWVELLGRDDPSLVLGLSMGWYFK
jgi:hypothetical protein